ncbi:valine-tRNA ligase [Ceratobasidium sp. AG-Ba]|nr:valine-tRNA ligase [Ceratobasidium sp. AG-Ba]
MEVDEQPPLNPRLKEVDMNLEMMEPNSLEEWCAEWLRLNEIDARRRDEFALKGVYTNRDGHKRRACIDFENSRVPVQMVPSQTADVDSVIMIVKNKFSFTPGLRLSYFILQSETHTL